MLVYISRLGIMGAAVAVYISRLDVTGKCVHF